MSDTEFQPVVRNRRGSAVKYPEQQQSLASMSFKASAISSALEISSGDLNSAIVLLLGEIDSSDTGAITSNLGSKSEVTTKVHNKIMATYKVQKCKEKNSHDIGKCIYWHTKADRRRNPFDVVKYGCLECSPDQQEPVPCQEGDNCMRAHNKHEKMFHPDIFKMTMCQRGEANGAKCSRGVFCAFAHSYEDSRKTSTSYRNIEKSSPNTVVSCMPSNIHKYAGGKPLTNGLPVPAGNVITLLNKKVIGPDILLLVAPAPITSSSPSPVAVVEQEQEQAVTVTVAAAVAAIPLSPVYAPAPVLVSEAVSTSVSVPVTPQSTSTSTSTRRRGPSEPVSNQSLEVPHSHSHSQSPPHLTSSQNEFASRSQDGPDNYFTSTSVGLSLPPAVGVGSSYLSSPSSSESKTSLPLPQMQPLSGSVSMSMSMELNTHTNAHTNAHGQSQSHIQGQVMVMDDSDLTSVSSLATAAALEAQRMTQRRTRHRGPSGPVDNYFLGLLGSPSSPSPQLPLLSNTNEIDFDISDLVSGSPSTHTGTNTSHGGGVDAYRGLQEQLSNLRSDLLLTTSELEDKNIELLSVSCRLRESQDLTSSMCAANSSMALEIHRLRADLAATQLLLCKRDEDLTYVKSILKEREREMIASPLSLMMAAPSTNEMYWRA